MSGFDVMRNRIAQNFHFEVDKANRLFVNKALTLGTNKLNGIGFFLTVSGIGMMNFEKKIRATTVVKVCLSVVALAITILGITLLFLGNKNASLTKSLNEIRGLEQSGHYVKALEIAKQKYQEALKLKSNHYQEGFAQAVKENEKGVLKLGFSRLLFDEQLKPRQKLIELLKITGMEINESNASITAINAWAQKNLLRQGKERWDEQDTKFEALKPKMMPLLTELGFINATNPSFNEYEGALVHGALLSRVRLRLNYLIEQWKKGVKFTHLYFIGGDRPLEPKFENKETLLQVPDYLKIRAGWQAPVVLPTTESEMIKWVWDQTDVPEDLRKQVQVHFISAPMKKDPKTDQLTVRPNTNDTVEAWLKTSPNGGKYLSVTNCPYIRQDIVLRSLTPGKYEFDTIGPKVSENEKMSIVVDEVGRFIFQTMQMQER